MSTRSEYAVLTDVEVDELKVGVNILRCGKSGLIVFLNADGELRACENICRHQGGTFAPDIEDAGSIVKCTRHQWALDVSKMEYVNPPNVHRQKELVVQRNSVGKGVSFFKEQFPKPWDVDFQEVMPIKPGELTVTYITHACLEIKVGGKKLITDPWLVGPAFMRGWWLAHEPPTDIWERLNSCDALWISHSHTDHLNLPTLTKLAKQRVDIPIYVGELCQPVIRKDVADLGFTNISVVPVGKWISFGEHGRLMINDDDTLPDVDSWLLVEYKGHRICNFVDCSSPSAFNLPNTNVDLILTDFASGASGFPSCYAPLHGEEKVVSLANAKRTAFLRKVVELAQHTSAKSYVPVAGYFVPSHPNDADVKRLNKQNSPAEAITHVKKFLPHLKTWIPFPGGTFDVATFSGTSYPSINTFLKTSWDHDEYVRPIIEQSKHSFVTLDAVQAYFDWASFASYDLLLQVIETDDQFKRVVREFWVDFKSERALVSSYKPRQADYLYHMKVRSSSFRVVLQQGSSWDDIWIGFQGRFNVVPDIYHFKFINHFSNTLPESKHDIPLFGVKENIWFTNMKHLMLAVLVVLLSSLVAFVGS